MSNSEIARQFAAIADVLGTKRENTFRIRTLARLATLARRPGREER